jgi:outer membrane protein assembly factor BamB
VVAWEWPDAADGTSLPAINPVVTGNGSVYVATESYYCAATLYALDGLSGAVRWTKEFPEACSFNPPAFGGDRLYLVSTGDEGAELWALNTENGEQVFRSRFDNQWYEVLAPTVYDGAIYTNGGQGGVHAFNHAGVPLWNGPADDIDVYAPAVNAAHVYHYSGTTLEIHERATGRHLGSILDTAETGNFASYYGAPVIGGHGNVIVYSRSGTDDGRVLSSFDVNAKSLEWSTSREYDTAPAVANGVVYAAGDDGMTVDAIDETTGKVLWSWSPTPGQGDTGFRHNIVVTNDVLLVSTDVAVYAVDLATRQTAWRYAEPGRLALSGRFLFLATGADASDGRLLALDLGGQRQGSAAPAAALPPQPLKHDGTRPDGALQALIARAAALAQRPAGKLR